MTTSVLLLLLLLQVKHWYVDFVNQTNEEVAGKGIYGNWQGIKHSVKHGIGTMLCVLLITGYVYIVYAIILGILDSVTHYHIDWTKMNYGNRDITTPMFWNHLGLDQMMHQMIYILIAFLIT